jgi:radical SAM protein with 4Fe4S-binding SPASM domain
MDPEDHVGRVAYLTSLRHIGPARAERLVAAGLDWLHVSLDGATAATYESIRANARFETVRRNVLGLVAAKRRLGSGLPRLSLVFVAMRRNIEELPDLVRLAADWGVGRLFVQNLSHSFTDTDPAGAYREIRDFAGREALWREPDGRLEAVFAEASRVAAEEGVELRLPRLREDERPPRAPGDLPCHWPYTSAYVTHRGRVQPCCMVMGADRAVLGDVAEHPFAEIWAGEAYASFRAALESAEPPEVCAGCSLYRGVF